MNDENERSGASDGSVVEEFKAGDWVYWGSASGGSYTRKVGIVVAVVEAGETPVPPDGLRCNSAAGYGMPRDHRSYLVRVGNKKEVLLASREELGSDGVTHNTQGQQPRKGGGTHERDE